MTLDKATMKTSDQSASKTIRLTSITALAQDSGVGGVRETLKWMQVKL